MRKTKVVVKPLVHKHAFRFKPSGGGKPIVSWAIVKSGKQVIDLELKPADVRLSMELKGCGNTQTCTMALCTKRQSYLFHHPVEGYIDWQYSRAYVVSKISKKTNMPSECYVYTHNDNIAKLNDSRGGQAKLLAMLEKSEAEGNPPRRIRLLKARVRGPSSESKSTGVRDGSRTSKVATGRGLRGAGLRFAMATLGGVDE
jgi:hypothetical protein